MESKQLGGLFFLVLLFAAQMGIVVADQQQQPRVCEARSGQYRIPCFENVSCAQMCVTEGFTGGSCDFLRRCMCQKRC